MIESIKFINSQTNEAIVMDGDSADYLIDTDNGSLDWGGVDAKHNTFNFPSQVGSYISSSMLEDRDVSFFGYIIGPLYSDIIRKKKVLSAFFNPLNEIEIQANGYSLFGRPESNVKYGKEYKTNNVVFCRFTVSLLCNKPMWKTSKPKATTIAILRPNWKFKWVMVNEKGKGTIFGKRRRALLQQVTNSGAIPAGVNITIRANGIVNNPELKIVETQEIIKINKELRDEEEVVISTVDGERYVIGRENEGSPWVSYLKYFDLDSSWVKIPVGTITFGFSTSSSEGEPDDTYKNMDVVVSYDENIFNHEEE